MILFDDQETEGGLPITIDEAEAVPARIKVVGVGGGGGVDDLDVAQVRLHGERQRPHLLLVAHQRHLRRQPDDRLRNERHRVHRRQH